jgi:hypothetical protein
MSNKIQKWTELKDGDLWTFETAQKTDIEYAEVEIKNLRDALHTASLKIEELETTNGHLLDTNDELSDAGSGRITSTTKYVADIVHLTDPTTIVCTCDGCQWSGMASELKPIGDCDLTPGHESPAGRCPDCETLSYVVTKANSHSHQQIRLGSFEVSLTLDSDGHISLYVKSMDGSKVLDVESDIGTEDEVCLRATTALIEKNAVS